MKKIKQFSLKAMLLTIAAALTIGFTGCSDELSGDQTQGKPGYLTINLKTLKPVQNKLGTAAVDDYKLIKNLNLFVFTSAGDLLINKWYDNTTTFDLDGGATSLPIQVNTLPTGCYVVAVANYGSEIDDITTYAQLEAKSISTIKNFATDGLHMTGRGDIDYSAVSSYTYSATVKIAPVEAKITVNWNITAGSIADYYDVTGVYVLNAIAQTTMPIILNTTLTPETGNINPTATTNNISLVGATRTAMTGLAAVANSDFNFYTMTLNAGLLSDEKTSEITSGVLDAGYTAMAKPFHYYVGENYNTDVVPSTAGAGVIRADNTEQNENTLVVIRVTPKSDAPAYIRAMGHKYYTYAFTKNSTGLAGQNISNLGDVPTTGFSVRRKTNYQLTFNLSEMGADDPFTRMSTLTVNVQAQGWDDVTPSF
jgi:hypothetical protein